MKNGRIVAISGLLIMLVLFGYSYYTNQASTPALPEKIAAPNATVPVDKEAPASSTTADNQQGSVDTNEKPEKATNNPTATPENQTATSSVKAVENKVPRNAAEAIEQGINNGESMWLLFRSTTCAPCVEMQKVFDQLQPEYKGKVRFIAIDVNDRTNMDVLQAWQIRYIPTTFIVDSTGKLSYQNVGVIPTAELKKELDKVVK